jgi:hypothetical protein
LLRDEDREQLRGKAHEFIEAELIDVASVRAGTPLIRHNIDRLAQVIVGV